MTMTIPIGERYQTSDLALAALIHLFYPLAAVDRGEPQRALFAFTRDEHLDELLRRYWQRELTVEPQAYFQSLRSIKARLYEAPTGYDG